MNFTLAYFSRLELWWMVAAGIQGVLIVGSWRAWERSLAGKGAGLRHRLACLHFMALLVLPLATVALVHLALVDMGAEISRASPTAGPGRPAGDGAVAWRVSALTMLLWLAGAVASALWLARDAWQAARLRRELAPAEWVGAVDRLARGWMRGVDLRVAAVAVPQVVGIRRPVLLLPRELAAWLAPAERDAVLLHELAHVHRRDFLWNLLQRCMLVLVWFQPAAWWLHGRLARERELCCDALAVRHGASPLMLGKALLRLAEHQVHGGLSMGLSGRGELVMRVQRLLGLQAAGAIHRRSAALAAALSLLCVSAIGLGRLGMADPTIGDLYIASALGPTVYVAARDPAGTFTLRVRQGRVVQASVDHRQLPREDIVQFGHRVTLVDAARAPILSLRVTPQGRVQWNARPGDLRHR